MSASHKTNTRKVIQIAAGCAEDDGEIIIALCNDGTMWTLDCYYCKQKKKVIQKWYKLEDVPQENIE